MVDLTHDMSSVTSVPSSVAVSSPTSSSHGADGDGMSSDQESAMPGDMSSDSSGSDSSDPEFAIPEDMSSDSSDSDSDEEESEDGMAPESTGFGNEDILLPELSSHLSTSSDLPGDDTEELVSHGLLIQMMTC